MECLLLVVRLLKEGRLEAAVRVLGWSDERLNEEVEGENERVGGMRRGRDDDGAGLGEGGDEREGVMGRGRDWGGEDGTGSVGPI